MSDLRELYQELIVDHGRRPRNFGKLVSATCSKEGYNPLCGDKITLHVMESNGFLEKLHFEGAGCAISIASASLLTEALTGKTRAEFDELFSAFHELVTQGKIEQTEKLGKLAALAGVAEFPARVKCATLAWHTLKALLTNDLNKVSTE